MLWIWISRLVYHYQYARTIQTQIEGCTFRRAWSYSCEPEPDGDPVEDAVRFVRKLRGRP